MKKYLGIILSVIILLASTSSVHATLNSLPTTMSTPPTVTLSSANASSSITDGVFKSILSSDFVNYGHRLGQNSTTNWYLGTSTTPNLNTPNSWANAAPYALEWNFTGQVFEIHLLGNGGTYKLLVDGHYATSAAQTLSATDYQSHYLKVDFGSSATRKIRLETANNFALDGIVIGPSDSISPTTNTGPRVIVLGDSYAEGQNGSGNILESYVQQLGLLMGWNDIWGSGSGGTGYLNPATSAAGRFKFADRLTSDVINYNPDIVIVAGGFNDANSYTESQIQTEATSLFSTIRTNLPQAKLIVVGPWSPYGSIPSSLTDARDAVKAAATNSADLFIDTFTGQNYINGTAVGTASGQWITSSNQSTYISSDTVHPSTSGHAYIGDKLAHAIDDADILSDRTGVMSISPATNHFAVGDTFSAYVVIQASENFKAASATVSASSNLEITNVSAAPSAYGPCNFQNTIKSPTTSDPSFNEYYNQGYASNSCTLYTLTVHVLSGGVGTITLKNASIISSSTGKELIKSKVNGKFTLDSSPTLSGTITVSPATSSVNVNDTFDAYVVIQAGENFSRSAATVGVSSNLQILSVDAPPSAYGPCNFQNETVTPTTSDPSFDEYYNSGYASNSCTLYKLHLKALSSGTGTVSISNGSVKSTAANSEIFQSSSNGVFTIN